ncbi:unnamed protein product [Anisakis simplex]|uniref:D-2-hydroxyglutarate dehydrogenase, mitochondrial n=1 Tax=Anisakis simplex TaxID=6269 RepID=A0A0M3KB92_ANISI|nr:unnamed protein product [Anisakis simplex]
MDDCSAQIAQYTSLRSFEKCREIVRMSKDRLGEVLSALELIDADSMQCVLQDHTFHKILNSNPPFYILIETTVTNLIYRFHTLSGSNERHDQEKLAGFLTEAIDREIIIDGVQASSRQEVENIWRIREAVPVMIARSGYVYKHDVSLPLEYFYRLTEVIRERLAVNGDGVDAKVFTFGHIGDGNSHLNIVTEHYSQEVADRLYPFLYDWVVEHNGSVSAEHGVGQVKREYAKYGKGSELGIAKQLKQIFDPRNILSPYKMF